MWLKYKIANISKSTSVYNCYNNVFVIPNYKWLILNLVPIPLQHLDLSSLQK